MRAATALWWIFLCAGCAGGKGSEGAGDDSGSPTDLDGDGVPAATDCNDSAPDVHPGATETCNGIDDDCNGDVDDGIDLTFFRDSDGDGYGDAKDRGVACAVPDGWVTDSTDCDDSAPDVNPGAVEICDVDGADEDCNGLANDDDPGATNLQTWYTDSDGDGFGLESTSVQLCFGGAGLVDLGTDCNDADPGINPAANEVCDPLDVDEDCDGLADGADPEGPAGLSRYWVDADGDAYGDASDPGEFFCDGVPSGYVTVSEDCDDSAPLVNPDARENCGDGIDNDCVGGIDDCGPIADFDLEDSDTSLDSVAADAFHGSVVAGLGDINGDGVGDFATGGWNYDSLGRAWIFEGPMPSGAYDPDDVASAVIDGEVEFGSWAFAIAGAGDVNADGYDDVLIGPSTTSASGGHLWLGPISDDTVASTADAIWSDDSEGGLSGKAVAGDFDFDGNGLDDYLVGAEDADDGSGTFAGAAYLVYGPGTGTFTLADADVRFGGTRGGGLVGHAITGVPDMDGDGLDELAIGSPLDEDSKGRTYLYYGTDLAGELVLNDKTADATYEGATLNDQLGFQVSRATDMNGDGYGDLLVSALYTSIGLARRGSVYVIAGPGDTSGAADSIAIAELEGEAFEEMIGYALDGSADLNGDGFSDILVGSPFTDAGAGAASAGAAYFVYGPQSGDVSLADARCELVGSTADEAAGISVAFIGDQSGDGTAEILVGAPYASSGSAYIVDGDRL